MGYISAQRLASERSKSFPVSFSLQTKAKRKYVSLGSPALENIPQVPGKRLELDQNHDARNAVSATLSVLK